MNKVPVIINNRDLLDVPRKMVADLLKLDYIGEVTILDNGSTYRPLLEWYDSNPPCLVVRRSNLGNHGPWNSGIIDKTADYYVTTDSDIDIGECPADLFDVLRIGLEKHPEAIKSGPSHHIDDLPDENPMKQDVIREQSGSWKLLPTGYYDGPTDTTFAMYRRGTGWGGYAPAVRSPPPYILRHMPWYWHKGNMPDDYWYYLHHMQTHGILWSVMAREKYGISKR